MQVFLLNILLMGAVHNNTLASEPAAQILQLPGDITEVVFYYADGQIKQIGFMEDGQKTGEWISFSPTGEIVAKAYFENNKKVGKWKVYNEQGDLTYKIQYKNGQKVWAQQYDEEGNTIAFNYK